MLRRFRFRRNPAPAEPRPQHFGELLDNLRALASATHTPRVVVAGVSGDERLEGLRAGLQEEAAARQLRLLLGELSEVAGGRQLRAVAPDSHLAPQPLAGNPGVGAAAWLERAAASCDFIWIEAPPLASAVDAALLARSCDGLLVVVETDLTGRLALRTAVERVRAVGCKLLGLVVLGTPKKQPYWLRKLLPKTLS